MFQQRERFTVREDFGRAGFRRLWDEARKQYGRRGEIGNRIRVRVPDLAPEECELINGFLPVYKRPGDTLDTTLRELEGELLRSRYKITLRQLFEELDGKPFLTCSELAELEDRDWIAMFETARMNVGTSEPILAWLDRLERGQTAGYRTFREHYRQEKERAQWTLRYCATALCLLQSGAAFRLEAFGNHDIHNIQIPQGRLPKDQSPKVEGPEIGLPEIRKAEIRLSVIRLPVLAAHVTGDSHAFDLKYTAGRLLWYAIREIWNRENEDSHNWQGEKDDGLSDNLETDSLLVREVYRRAGIRDDDVSSQVLVWGLPFSQGVIPVSLTLQQVESMTNWPRCQDLFVVENPPVFSTLLDAVPTATVTEIRNAPQPVESGPILVCISGQPSTAAVLLIDRLLKHAEPSAKLWYSGDFDVNGILIADSFAKRYPDHFVPWRMDRETYKKRHHSQIGFNSDERIRLLRLKPLWDHELGIFLANTGFKCFQETVLPDLIRDWLAAIRQFN